MASKILPHVADTADADDVPDVASQIARRRIAERETELAAEVRRLMKGAQVVFRRCGTKESPRVADILAEVGMSNDAFYRHFTSKDELVVAIIEDGTRRVCKSLAEAMEGVAPREQVALFVRSLIGTVADPKGSENLRALMWNVARTADDSKRRVAARASLAKLLVQPMHALGSTEPERDAYSVTDTALGRMEHFMWRRETPSTADIEHVVQFCLRAVGHATPPDATDTEKA